MIVVDSSVWISHFRDDRNEAVEKLRSATQSEILLGDLILLELLQGARSDRQAAQIEQELAGYTSASMLDRRLAIQAASNYRHLRSLGITIRRAADLVIGTFCLVNDHSLLHRDRDFTAMERHLDLKIY